MNALVVEQVGPLVTIQDLGRPGWWSAGVGVSGAADRSSLRLANRLVGNPESAACLEVVLGGVTLRALRPVTLAVTGAPAPATVDGTPVGHAGVVELAAGRVLRLGFAAVGVRSYVAVRGGIDVPAVLGSRSYDTMSGLGPKPVTAPATLAIGPPPVALPIVDVAPIASIAGGPIEARVVLGPRDDWFDCPSNLFAGRWRVSSDADRIGVRMDRDHGPALVRTIRRELATEGTPLGAIQVPPDGRPVIFLADHPITGGYPVIGVIVDADVDRIAQGRPGTVIRFVRAIAEETS